MQHHNTHSARTIRDICKMYDLPIWLVLGARRPLFFRLRWAIRRFTGYQG